jgi:hypothetical protein
MRFHILSTSDYRSGTEYNIYTNNQLKELYQQNNEEENDKEEENNEEENEKEENEKEENEKEENDKEENDKEENEKEENDKEKNDKEEENYKEEQEYSDEEYSDDTDDEIMDNIISAFYNEYYGDFDYEISSDNYDLVLVYGKYDNIQTYKINTYNDYNEANKYSDYIFYKIHGFKPFVVTGFTAGYKETGHYPELEKELEDTINKLQLYPDTLSKKLNLSDFVISMICSHEGVNNILTCLPLF